MIVSIRFAAAAPSTTVCVTMADGQEWHTDAALPPDTAIRAMMHEWLAENAPAAFVPPALTVADYARAVDGHVEATARARGYNDAAKLMAWSLSTNSTWAAEGAAFIAWQDHVYLDVFAALAAWQGGAAQPTVAGLVASLPVIKWPA